MVDPFNTRGEGFDGWWTTSETWDRRDDVEHLLLIITLTVLVHGEDGTIWKPLRGYYTNKYCYSLTSQVPALRFINTRVFYKIWSIKGPPKNPAFMWKLNHEILPKSNLFQQEFPHFILIRGGGDV